jgi:hypothetical protein
MVLCSRNVVGHGVEEEDQKHTWMEDADAVTTSNYLSYASNHSSVKCLLILNI